MKSGKKTKEAHVRFTVDEYARVKMQADAAGKSASAFVHDSALHESSIHIADGKQVAEKIGKLHNQMILYHNDMRERLQALQSAVEAHARLLNSPCAYSAEAQETRDLFNMRVKAAVDVIQNAYTGYEDRVEEALHTILSDIAQTGGK